MNRAYSLFSIRSVDEEQRIIEGIATTPTLARDGDVLETKGIQFKLPLPFLYRHKEPLGTVTEANVSDDGIRVQIKVAPAGVAAHIDEAWRMIKAGIVPGLSIGWRTLKEKFDDKIGGYRITSSEWLELSAVPVPADANATITSIRSIDDGILAAIGNESRVVNNRITSTKTIPLTAGLTKGSPMKETIREQITTAEGKIAAAEALQNEIVNKCTEEGRTRSAEEETKCDEAAQEIKDLTKHIAFLKERETHVVARATPITVENTKTPEVAGQTRQSIPIAVQSRHQKGVGVARMAIALYHAEGNYRVAQELARENWPDDHGVEKALQYQAFMKQRTGVDAGDTTTSGWASQLVPAAQQLQNEFLEMLRPATIIGRIPGLRRVPFNVAVPVQTGAGTYGWVGEAAGKQVTSLTFSSVTLRWAKAAGIIVITEELAKFSSPSAEAIIRDEMLAGCARFLDAQFVGTAAEVSNVSPAGILNGISSTATTGTAASNFRTDMNNLLNNFTANNVDPTGITLLMSATQAMALSLMNTDLGVSLFPGINVNGGTVLGFPVVVSEAVGTKIIALNTKDILIAEEGIRIDVSREASVEMETAPAVGEQSPLSTLTNLKSLWQNNLVGFRVERYITWKRGRDSAVEYITANAYVP